VSFTKSDYADSSLAVNQDRITGIVWLTRDDNQGIYNAYSESSYDVSSPDDTEWAIGSVSQGVGNLTFSTWSDTLDDTVGNNILDSSYNPMVVHLITDDIYLDIEFTSWTSGGSGGGFSYTRSCAAAITPTPTATPVPVTPTETQTETPCGSSGYWYADACDNSGTYDYEDTSENSGANSGYIMIMDTSMDYICLDGSTATQYSTYSGSTDYEYVTDFSECCDCCTYVGNGDATTGCSNDCPNDPYDCCSGEGGP
jgi:hypothetical protein